MPDNTITAGLVAAIAFAAVGPVACGQPCEGPIYQGQSVRVGEDPFSIAVGDLNADGFPDVVAANAGDDSISVLINDGAGGVASRQDYAARSRPWAVAVADIDGDGDLDVAYCREAACPGLVTLWTNDGSGVLTHHADLAVGCTPRDVVFGDIDLDGDMDMAVVNDQQASVSILTNDGIGGFQEVQSVGTGDRPNTARLSDLDGDGDVDLVSASNGSGTITVWRNDGGIYTSGSEYAAGAGAQNMDVADLDGDGDMDAMVANPASQAVSVLFNHGTGVFAFPVTLETTQNAIWVHGADVNDDGIEDLLASNPFLSVWLSDGEGGFAPRAEYPAGGTLLEMTTADADGDGDLDVYLGDGTANAVSILTNDGHGGFAATIASPIDADPQGFQVHDLDGDGVGEALVYDGDRAVISVYRRSGDGFVASGRYDGFGSVRGLDVADLTADGVADLAVIDRSTDSVVILPGIGGGAFGPGMSVPTAAGAGAPELGDLDGDGLVDVLIVGSGGLAVHRNGGGGVLGAATGVPAGADAESVAVADLDGDGDLDVVARSGTREVMVLLNDGTGEFASSERFATGHDPVGIQLVDLDGDGVPDIAALAGVNTEVTVLMNQGDGTFSLNTEYAVDRWAQVLATADIDADGDVDLLAASSRSRQISVLENAGEGVFAFNSGYLAGDGPRGVGIVSQIPGRPPEIAVLSPRIAALELLSIASGCESCPADLDGDGELTIFDFLAFGNLFDLMDPAADFDGDGAFTIFDFLAFQNAFDLGCP